MLNIKNYLAIILLAGFVDIYPQILEEIPTTIPGIYRGDMELGDYNNDDLPDILMTGQTFSGTQITCVYRNNGDETFTDIDAGLQEVSYGRVSWGDYDNDNDLDILLTGSYYNNSYNYILNIYRNNGDGSFSKQTNIPFKGMSCNSSEWGDYDNDGDLDILLTGYWSTNYTSVIYKNNGNNSFIEQIGIKISGLMDGVCKWYDMDHDGDLDILLSGLSPVNYNFLCIIYKNSGDNTFTNDTLVSINTMYDCTASWEDYDSDGNLDVFVTGKNSSNNNPEIKIFKNTGDYNFSEQTGYDIQGTSISDIVWSDYDNDGDMDFIITGDTSKTGFNKYPFSALYNNDGINVFTEETGISLSGIVRGSIKWGDFDADGDLDLFLAGDTSDVYYTDLPVFKIYKNNGTVFNSLSSSPGNLSASVSGNSVNLSWDNSTDAETPVDALSYNLYVSTIKGLTDIYPPHADIATGYRKIVSCGDIHNNNYHMNQLDAGKYYWSVQAIDRAFAGSVFANVDSFNIVFSNSISPAENQCLAPGQPGIPLTVNETAIADSRQWKFSRHPGGPYNNILEGVTSVSFTPEIMDIDSFYVVCVSTKDGISVTSNEVLISKFILSEAGNIWLPGLLEASLAWGDYDNDNDPDILLTGMNPDGPLISKIYRNGPCIPDVSGNGINAEIIGGVSLNTGYINNAVDLDGDDGLLTMPAGIVSTLADFTIALWINQDSIKTWSRIFDFGSGPDVNMYLTPSSGDDNLRYSITTSGYMNEQQINTTSNLQKGKWIHVAVTLSGNVGRIYVDGAEVGINTNMTLLPMDLGITENNYIGFSQYSHDPHLDGKIDNFKIFDIALNEAQINDLMNFGDLGSITEIVGYSFDEIEEAAFSEINAGLTGVLNGSAKWADYDNDNDIDILLTGKSSTGMISKIYKNNGEGVFIEQTDISLTGVDNSAVDWGDFDNDGDLDILLTGRSSETPFVPVSKIYQNNGENIFTEQTGISLTAVDNGDVSWCDYDLDGDLDILLTGFNDIEQTVSKIYRNNGDSTFTEQTGVGLIGVTNSCVAWGDYNNDQYPDILITGYNFDIAGKISKIYKNNGDNTFSEQTGIGLIPVEHGTVAWADYDNDGDLDILLTGNSDMGPVTKIYQNNGNENFVELNNRFIIELLNSTAAWADYDNDNDLDFIISGNSDPELVTKIYNNVTDIKNTRPDAPQGMNISVSGSEVTLSWGISKDDESSWKSISYNISIGTSPGTCDIKSSMITADSSFHLIPGPGNVGYRTSWTIENMPAGTYFWSVQAIDQGFLASEISSESFIKDLFIDEGITYDGTSIPYLGDYDRDGDLDILSSTFSSTTIFENDGNVYTDINAGIITGSDACAWSDYDNDGDLDIAITGNTGGDTLVSRIYRNDDGVFTEIDPGMEGIWMGTVGWCDYDNDGDLDLFLYGSHEFDDMGEPVGKLYRNDGNDIFTDTKIEIEESRRGAVDFGDYNNDGYADILVCGSNLSGNVFSSVLKNTKNNTFTNINAGLGNYKGGDVCWGDYDNDGDLDIFIMGGLSNGEGTSKIFRNDGNDTFTDIGIDLPGISSYSSTAEWGDYDNDGDLDILISYDKCIFRNEGDDNFIVTRIGLDSGYPSAWGDMDNDGDLDIVLYNKVFINTTEQVNLNPEIPGDLKVKISNMQAKLSWAPSFDDHTPSSGLSYNVRIGSSPGACDILSPMVDNVTGFARAIPEMGNTNCDTFKIINELPIGTYFWSVQSIDNGYLASDFSEEQSFEILPVFTKSLDIPILGDKAVFGDYDKDGDLDILHADFSGIIVYRNDDSVFTENYVTRTRYDNDPIEWGDYDNDGDLDIITCDSIFRNDMGDVFSNTGIGFSLSRDYPIVTGDYDADGDLDFLYKSGIYRNDKDDIFKKIELDLVDAGTENISWFDYDNDGDLDIIISYGLSTNTSASIFKNEGDDQFRDINAGLVGLWWTTISFSDFDNDSDLDILMIGMHNENDYLTKIYKNDGNDKFTDINTNIRGYELSTINWGDYDDDGYIDIVISGQNNGRTRTRLYLNNHDETFDEMDANIANRIVVRDCGDYDNDGDLDLITDSGMYRNNFNFSDKEPPAPSNPESDLKGFNCILSWDIPEVEHSSGFSYNLKIGTTKENCSVKSPMIVPGYGNIQSNKSWVIKDLKADTYYWQVQAIDQSFVAGPWSVIDSILITDVSPDFLYDTVCLGNITTFIDISETTDSLIRWKWNFGDENQSTEVNPQHLYEYADTFNVTLWVYSFSGDSAKRVHQVIVNSGPIAKFSVAPVCIKEVSEFIDDSDTSDIVVDTWLWDFGDGESSTHRGSITKTFTESKITTLTIIAKNGCTDVEQDTAEVGEKPVAKIYIRSGYSKEFCYEDYTVLEVVDNGNADYQYQWFNYDAPLNERIDSLVVYEGGQYSLTVTNPVGNCQVTTDTIKTNSVSRPPVPELKVISGTTDLCPDDWVVLSIDNYLTDESIKYDWLWKNKNYITNGGQYLKGNLDAGEYKARAYIGSRCFTLSDSIVITHKKAPDKPMIYVNDGPDLYYMSCDNTTAEDYKWYYNDKLQPNAKKYYYFAGSQLGRYYVIVKEDYSECYVKSYEIMVPGGYVNMNGLGDESSLKIFPNPAYDLLNIFVKPYNEIDEIYIKLSDIYGRIISSKHINKPLSVYTDIIKISDLPEGVYYLIVQFDKKIMVKKILKK